MYKKNLIFILTVIIFVAFQVIFMFQLFLYLQIF